MRRLNKAMPEEHLASTIKLLRYGPAHRPQGNLRIMTLAAIAKTLSISTTTVWRILKSAEQLLELEMR